MKKNLKKIIIFLIILVFILIGIIYNVLKKVSVTKQNTVSVNLSEEDEKRLKNIEDEAIIQKLSNMTEEQRMKYYVSEFIKNLESRHYSKAYLVLNEGFKKNYFSTEEEFREYVKKYIPKEMNVKYNNMERLGNIYVYDISIKDILNYNNPNDFDFYIVVQENGYNDIELSFSMDKPMQNFENTEE